MRNSEDRNRHFKEKQNLKKRVIQEYSREFSKLFMEVNETVAKQAQAYGV